SPTSFIGPWYPGIHHVPSTTWPQRCSHSLYSSQATDTQNTHPQHQACPLRHPTANHPALFHNPSSTHSEKHTSSTRRTLHTTHPRQTRPKQTAQVHMLLRKEVIQPHLPVRLPCYDFVPIASPTFDHSPHTVVGPWAS